ncbi:hypothetical protein BofuT4_uP106680.1 [Botrytis cinerea T4]|uniref:Uncharacterized protein n=1 Tax=Botryotinia fuckeliana (strain T4) TaxID=999810 RepID=G2Y6N2_BOTF4|nr:hypothetical protein BofuT4_uP106680.1 [Botrytis cinerea T4]
MMISQVSKDDTWRSDLLWTNGCETGWRREPFDVEALRSSTTSRIGLREHDSKLQPSTESPRERDVSKSQRSHISLIWIWLG